MFIHPSAEVEPGAVIGEGSRIWRHCHVMAEAVIGKRCVLGQGCFVAARVRIGDGCRIQNNVSLYEGLVLGRDVFIGPCAVFTNVLRPRVRFPKKSSQYDATVVGDAATIGANATIVCGHCIGEAAFVAAGAVVSRDVPDRALVAGVPARIIGWVCDCGETIARGANRPQARIRCKACARSYRAASSGGMERADSMTDPPPAA